MINKEKPNLGNYLYLVKVEANCVRYHLGELLKSVGVLGEKTGEFALYELKVAGKSVGGEISDIIFNVGEQLYCAQRKLTGLVTNTRTWDYLKKISENLGDLSDYIQKNNLG